MRSNELIVYRGITKDPVFAAMTALMEKAGPAREDADACAAMLIDKAGEYGFTGNLWHAWLANLLVNDENTYSRQSQLVGQVEGSINEAVQYDFEIIARYFSFDFTGLIEELHAPELSLILDYKGDVTAARMYNRRILEQIHDLTAQLEEAADLENADPTSVRGSSGSTVAEQAAKMKAALTAFYHRFGVGKFGLHKAFRLEVDAHNDPHIVPIRQMLHVSFDDLVGYESQKKKLRDNTDAFVAGRPCNNVLLYGEAGTGKSSSIKALANEYYDRGLRVIEIYRHQFRYLNDVIADIRSRRYRFIIYMDDLSFEEFETEYKYLKAVIEGGLEKKPDNVLIYATSNRRHLIRESFHDRDGVDIADKHGGDTVQEKLSLSGRFGVSIYYGAPSFQEYTAMVEELARRSGITMEKEKLDKEAIAWEMRHSGLSGRTAQQFIDYLRGTELAVQE